jgi:23S rRNA (cytidine1920-2'-O)/16S rRNA (cytidine1409-2'-O)-methyltransferase
VTVGGAPAATPARLVAPGEAVVVQPDPPRFVGRGGRKLDAALDRFGLDVAGLRALDAGASTGGFTDCLLQRGAAQVVAVDVGYGQLHESLRHDPRVVNLERTNVRAVGPDDLGGPVDVVVADLSFISLRAVADALLGACRPGSPLVLLVKPQFEASREQVSRGRGVVADQEVWRQVLDEVIDALQARGASIMGAMASPLTGADGNVELLVHARAGGPGAPPPGAAAVDTRALVDAAVAEGVAVLTRSGLAGSGPAGSGS